jgi:hypothetical protein
VETSLSEFGGPTNYTAGGDVSVIDTDALLGDACDALLTGVQSRILAAIDGGAARIVMSDVAFFELGRMSAKCSRGRGVNDGDLRKEIQEQYLPRIPVVRVPSANSGCWMPSADEVKDPDDRAHVQVPRLITARVVYSHDRDLRRPGFAPPTPDAYDSRIGHLAAFTQSKRAEIGILVSARLTFSAVSWLVSKAADLLRVKGVTAWGLVAASVVGISYAVLANEPRPTGV